MINIIVPIYNEASYLRKCLDSLLAQTITDWEAILVDDCSKDNSAEIAAEYVKKDARFQLIQQEVNNGQSVARNIGLEMAKGEYVAFLDADDYLDCDYLERHIKAIGNADYVQSGYRRIHVSGEILEQKMPRHRYQFVSPCMRLYRTSFLHQHHLSFPIGMIYEDVIFSLNVWGVAQRVVSIRYTGYNYIINPQSTTSKINLLAQKQLFNTIFSTNAPNWLIFFTILRLKLHFSRL
ncbi:MAG: glycosyltransferase [Paludibacteraceae bacterium]|nr:glycosyltransferase [Paludibacteraceae bacterium]